MGEEVEEFTQEEAKEYGAFSDDALLEEDNKKIEENNNDNK